MQNSAYHDSLKKGTLVQLIAKKTHNFSAHARLVFKVKTDVSTADTYVNIQAVSTLVGNCLKSATRDEKQSAPTYAHFCDYDILLYQASLGNCFAPLSMYCTQMHLFVFVQVATRVRVQLTFLPTTTARFERLN